MKALVAAFGHQDQLPDLDAGSPVPRYDVRLDDDRHARLQEALGHQARRPARATNRALGELASFLGVSLRRPN